MCIRDRLHIYEPADLQNLTARLNSPGIEVTNRKLIKEAITVLVNQKTLPVQDLANLKIASVALGAESITPFQKMLDKYTKVDHFFLGKDASAQEVANLRSRMDNYNLVIAGVMGIHLFPGSKYGTTENQRNLLADFIRENNVDVYKRQPLSL